MPRFVVLTHDHPVLHWDLMLEQGNVLRTWRLAEPPDSSGPGAAIDAEPLGDHRPAYLDYEGPLSGGRGEVRRWDAGEYVLLAEEESRVELRLSGEKLKGRAVLERGEPGGKWVFYLLAG